MDAEYRYFDLQVNGYAGVDFNKDDLSPEQLHLACERLRADGVRILATVITDDVSAMFTRLERLSALRNADPLAREVIAGVHIEGPFLNEQPGYRGAHPADAIRPADPDTMRRLLGAAGGLTRLVTLAPERDVGSRVTKLLHNEGIVVSAGHCDPSLDELRAAIDAGLSMFTHLGNGCPMHLHRHDNVVQRVLSLADRLRCCFIADGVHVPFVALRNYIRLVGLERAIVVTDAIAAAGLGPGRYTVGRWDLLIGDDMVARAPDRSHFVGSAVTMPRTRENLMGQLGLDETDVARLTRDNPLRAVGFD